MFVLIRNLNKKNIFFRTSRASASGLDPELEATAGTMNDSKLNYIIFFFIVHFGLLKLYKK